MGGLAAPHRLPACGVASPGERAALWGRGSLRGGRRARAGEAGGAALCGMSFVVIFSGGPVGRAAAGAIKRRGAHP